MNGAAAAGAFVDLNRPPLSIRKDVGARSWFIPFALALTALPLLWPTVPPLVDLPNHMSRYRIALDYATSPFFRQWFDFHWAISGNLGVDLLVQAAAPWLGIEMATKLVILAIPLLTVAGFALIAREAHGRVPATAVLAFLFAYNFAFNFGFVNHCLSVALALLAYGLWLRMGRLDQRRLRALLFVPVGVAVWLAHACGWGMLGLMIFASELVTRREAGDGWPRAGLFAAGGCLPLAAPLALIVAIGGGAGALTLWDLRLPRKLALIFMSLKNGDAVADLGSVAIVWLTLIVATARKDLAFDRRLLGAGAILSVAFLLMPERAMGAGYADMRIAPYALALLVLAVRPVADTRFTRALSLLAVALFAARMAYQTATYARLDRVYSEQLAALDHLPLGARVFGFARTDCLEQWRGDRLDHLNRMAIVRRQAYTNDTWPPSVSRTLVVHDDLLAGYQDFDSQRFAPAECRFAERQTMDGALAALPQGRFDYFWLIGAPPTVWPQRAWLRPIWHSASGALYRILPPQGR